MRRRCWGERLTGQGAKHPLLQHLESGHAPRQVVVPAEGRLLALRPCLGACRDRLDDAEPAGRQIALAVRCQTAAVGQRGGAQPCPARRIPQTDDPAHRRTGCHSSAVRRDAADIALHARQHVLRRVEQADRAATGTVGAGQRLKHADGPLVLHAEGDPAIVQQGDVAHAEVGVFFRQPHLVEQLARRRLDIGQRAVHAVEVQLGPAGVGVGDDAAIRDSQRRAVAHQDQFVRTQPMGRDGADAAVIVGGVIDADGALLARHVVLGDEKGASVGRIVAMAGEAAVVRRPHHRAGGAVGQRQRLEPAAGAAGEDGSLRHAGPGHDAVSAAGGGGGEQHLAGAVERCDAEARLRPGGGIGVEVERAGIGGMGLAFSVQFVEAQRDVQQRRQRAQHLNPRRLDQPQRALGLLAGGGVGHRLVQRAGNRLHSADRGGEALVDGLLGGGTVVVGGQQRDEARTAMLAHQQGAQPLQVQHDIAQRPAAAQRLHHRRLGILDARAERGHQLLVDHHLHRAVARIGGDGGDVAGGGGGELGAVLLGVAAGEAVGGDAVVEQQPLQHGQPLDGRTLAGERAGLQQLRVMVAQDLTDLALDHARPLRPERHAVGPQVKGQRTGTQMLHGGPTVSDLDMGGARLLKTGGGGAGGEAVERIDISGGSCHQCIEAGQGMGADHAAQEGGILVRLAGGEGRRPRQQGRHGGGGRHQSQHYAASHTIKSLLPLTWNEPPALPLQTQHVTHQTFPILARQRLEAVLRRFRLAAMPQDRFGNAAGAPVMQKRQLPILGRQPVQTPQRRGAPVRSVRLAHRQPVAQPGAEVVEKHVAVREDVAVGQGRMLGILPRAPGRAVAGGTAGIGEQRGAGLVLRRLQAAVGRQVAEVAVDQADDGAGDLKPLELLGIAVRRIAAGGLRRGAVAPGLREGRGRHADVEAEGLRILVVQGGMHRFPAETADLPPAVHRHMIHPAGDRTAGGGLSGSFGFDGIRRDAVEQAHAVDARRHAGGHHRRFGQRAITEILGHWRRVAQADGFAVGEADGFFTVGDSGTAFDHLPKDGVGLDLPAIDRVAVQLDRIADALVVLHRRIGRPAAGATRMAGGAGARIVERTEPVRRLRRGGRRHPHAAEQRLADAVVEAVGGLGGSGGRLSGEKQRSGQSVAEIDEIKQRGLEHPVAGVVGLDGDAQPLLRLQQHRVGMVGHHLAGIGGQHLEGVAVDVDRVQVRRQVGQFEDVAPALLQRDQRRRQAFMPALRPALLVDRPEGLRRQAQRVGIGQAGQGGGVEALRHRGGGEGHGDDRRVLQIRLRNGGSGQGARLEALVGQARSDGAEGGERPGFRRIDVGQPQGLASLGGGTEQHVDAHGRSHRPAVQRAGRQRVAVDRDDPGVGPLHPQVDNAGAVDVVETGADVAVGGDLDHRLDSAVDGRHAAEGAGTRGAAVGHEGAELSGLVQMPVLQQTDDIGIDLRRVRLLDDQNAGKAAAQQLHRVAVGMEEEGSGIGRGEFIDVALARLGRRLGQIGHAVFQVRQADAVPVDRGVLVQPVHQGGAQPLALAHADDRAGKAVGIGDQRRQPGRFRQDPQHPLPGDQLDLDQLASGGDRCRAGKTGLQRTGIGGGKAGSTQRRRRDGGAPGAQEGATGQGGGGAMRHDGGPKNFRQGKGRLRSLRRPPPGRPGREALGKRSCAGRRGTGAGEACLLADLRRVVEAVGALDLDRDAERGDGAFQRLLLGDEAVDAGGHQLVALVVVGGDHLVVGHLAAVGGVLDRLHRLHGVGHGGLDRGVGVGGLGGDQLRQRGTRDGLAVGALVAAVIDVHHADFVVIVRVVGVVGEAVMLLFRIVQHEAELHALACQLAIAQRSQAGQHAADAFALRRLGDGDAGLALGGPVGGHLGQIVDQHLRGDLQVLCTAVAMAVGAVLALAIVGGLALTRTRTGAVQVLAPQQELDGVVAGGDVRLHLAGLVQLVGQQLLRDLGGVDGLAAGRDLRVGDDVRLGVGVALAAGIALVDIVDQALIQRPGIHLAFPFVDDRVAEAEGFRLHVGNAGGLPDRARLLQVFLGRIGDQGVHRLLQRLGAVGGVLIGGMGDVGVGLRHVLVGRTGSLGTVRQQGNDGYGGKAGSALRHGGLLERR
ncbi:hypothetical protein Lal_00013818 [Lupinus albus]|nr:hypothetical protein Lal_00013818 [Lupinus albus]